MPNRNNTASKKRVFMGDEVLFDVEGYALLLRSFGLTITA
jgi:hypothetical protein